MKKFLRVLAVLVVEMAVVGGAFCGGWTWGVMAGRKFEGKVLNRLAPLDLARPGWVEVPCSSGADCANWSTYDGNDFVAHRWCACVVGEGDRPSDERSDIPYGLPSGSSSRPLQGAPAPPYSGE